MINRNSLTIFSDAPLSDYVAELFCCEMNGRISSFCSKTDDINKADLSFMVTDAFDADSYSIKQTEGRIIISATDRRGFIFATGRFLRNIEKRGNGIVILDTLFGDYHPHKSIRGHQLGYRTTPNTYDAWSIEDYRKYYLELMYFGVNTVEHIPYEKGVSKRNALMKYDEEELLVEACRLADEYNLDVSLWQPTLGEKTDEQAAERFDRLYSRLSRLDYVFVPGGDPGDLKADEFISRCKCLSKVLKKHHPKAQLWPSAQAPHSVENWGEEFVRLMKECPEEIDGVIYGPNHAYPLHKLRSLIPSQYPFRFYPDITHNVRCEYPVHTGYGEDGKDDWHFALAAGLSRECTNPRPCEYAKLYKDTKDYFIGSVSYSEGITDDVNKCIWSDLDYDNNADISTSVSDYCRLYFFGADTTLLARLIFDLEKNWVGDPALNETIDSTYTAFRSLYNQFDSLKTNWRFLQLMLRADCDKLIQDRRAFELDLINKAEAKVNKGLYKEAKAILETDFSADYKAIRNEIDVLADKLFELIGLQTNVSKYCADSWERGAILETIDLPVTDRAYLLSKYNETDWQSYFDRNKVKVGEYYYSVAIHGVREKQTGEVYMNFAGDNPSKNNGTLPTALFNVFDNHTFVTEAEGLDDGADYDLLVTYLNKTDDNVNELKITANGTVIYCGRQFGDIDYDYTHRFCTDNHIAARYRIDKGIIKNGRVKLEFSEPLMCVMFAELRIVKR